jgi:uncharacterized protein (TIGR02145 family)
MVKYSLKYIIIPAILAVLLATTNSCKKEDNADLTVITKAVSEITYHSAVSGVEWQGGDENTVEGGICYSTEPNPTSSDNVSTFDIDRKETASKLWISQLAPDETYYLRAYLINFNGSSIKTFYGSEFEFTTLPFDKTIHFNPALTYGLVSDIEGNSYNTIHIGTQEWMAENLRTTRLNDNTPIAKITFDVPWSYINTPGYNWYDNDSVTYKTTFGARYNWYAVNTGKLCPAGWHAPSDDEWETMCVFLGGPDFAAGKLKETGTYHWDSLNEWDPPNEAASNESGFTALPGLVSGSYGGWWSTTRMNPNDPPVVWCYYLFNSTSKLYRSEVSGMNDQSVRCIKD